MSVVSFAAIAPGNLAVVTGGASGIGLAAVRAFAACGMRVAILDRPGEALDAAAGSIDGASAHAVDVADPGAMRSLAATLGPASVLMNNAGIGQGGDVFASQEAWTRLLGVNLMGVLNGIQSFAPLMVEGHGPGLVINTGSKQGLTNPPGNPAYNTSKAAVNAYTQNLARDLRERQGSKVSAHLLIPGWTTTGEAEHRKGAWLAEQVVAYMEAAIGREEFFILCPDEETPNETDHKRILWNALDIIESRPALSRWHPEWKERFAAFMARD